MLRKANRCKKPSNPTQTDCVLVIRTSLSRCGTILSKIIRYKTKIKFMLSQFGNISILFKKRACIKNIQIQPQFSVYIYIYRFNYIIKSQMADKLSTIEKLNLDNNTNSNASKSDTDTQAKKKIVKGRWTQVQQLKYYLFLSHHKQRFQQNDVRRSLRMFKHMSVFIKSRNASQCRVRHLKTMRKYGGLQQSLNKYIEEYPKFYEQYEKVKDYLLILEDRAYCGDFQQFQQPYKGESIKNQNLHTNREQKIEKITQAILNVGCSDKLKQLMPGGQEVKIEVKMEQNNQFQKLLQFYWGAGYAIQPMQQVFYFL